MLFFAVKNTFDDNNWKQHKNKPCDSTVMHQFQCFGGSLSLKEVIANDSMRPCKLKPSQFFDRKLKSQKKVIETYRTLISEGSPTITF